MAKGGKVTLGCLGIFLIGVVIVIIGIVIIGFTSYNRFVKLEEQVNQTWAQVQNQYQRRYDLIPNLVETVKGYASHERETLQAVTEARSKVGGVTNLSAKDLTPENLANFQAAQAGLSGALQRLMVVIERYPDLKANQNFLQLQTQLEGTENRISVERRRFNESVQTYNETIRRMPQVLFARLFGFTEKVYFAAAQQAQEAPKVVF
jgi:LemA protein